MIKNIESKPNIGWLIVIYYLNLIIKNRQNDVNKKKSFLKKAET